jgi:hypothetical protein
MIRAHYEISTPKSTKRSVEVIKSVCHCSDVDYHLTAKQVECWSAIVSFYIFQPECKRIGSPKAFDLEPVFGQARFF